MILVQIILNKVLLVGTRDTTYIGKPVVTNAAVHAVVEEQVVHYLLIYLINGPKSSWINILCIRNERPGYFH